MKKSDGKSVPVDLTKSELPVLQPSRTGSQRCCFSKCENFRQTLLAAPVDFPLSDSWPYKDLILKVPVLAHSAIMLGLGLVSKIALVKKDQTLITRNINRQEIIFMSVADLVSITRHFMVFTRHAILPIHVGDLFKFCDSKPADEHTLRMKWQESHDQYLKYITDCDFIYASKSTTKLSCSREDLSVCTGTPGTICRKRQTLILGHRETTSSEELDSLNLIYMNRLVGGWQPICINMTASNSLDELTRLMADNVQKMDEKQR